MASSPVPTILRASCAFALAAMLSACGGGSSTTPPPPVTPSYAVTLAALNPNAVNPGGSATSTITVAPTGGYTGTVTLSCAVSGGGTPPPTCAVGTSSVSITSSTSGTSSLTVTTASNTPPATYTITVNAADANKTAPTDGPQTLQLATNSGLIQHIVIIFQENRTPDNLFQDPVLIANGADIASQGINSSGATVPLVSTTLGVDYDNSHKHDAFESMCDLDTTSNTCKMDGADLITVTCSQGATSCPPANPNFMYVQASDVQPYWTMAEQYTFADRMFQTNQGPSFPAHQFILSGTSAPSVGSNLFVAENPLGVGTSSADAGCTAPSAEYVSLIDPSGSETSNAAIFPCFEHPALTDELNTAGVSWRYYAPMPGSIWVAPNAIQHICMPQTVSGVLTCTGPDWTGTRPNVVFDETTVLTDIANGQLPQVSWVIPTGNNSDHAGMSTTTGGPSWVASVVNAIGNSSYWANTTIIIAWDDWGGWYDHVPPPKIVNDGTSWGSGYIYGFRVPMIVMSPYAKPKYISHVNHDFGSILKLIEETFAVPALGYADSNALDDLSDCFDYSQTPLTFQTIKSIDLVTAKPDRASNHWRAHDPYRSAIPRNYETD
jgi:phospholipase C